MAVQLPYFDPEAIGRRRLPDNKNYRANLNTKSSLIQSALFDLIASNYPKDTNTNLGIFYRTIAREDTRQQDSIEYINNDKVFTQTRIQYLQQILGERLFLNTQLAPLSSNDIDYRKLLIAIKNAYLQGSKKSVIEALINEFTNLNVNVKELYLEARKPGSAYGLTDTHKMVIELFVDDLIAGGYSIADITNNLAFFVNLVKPAHVLYDTKMIWTENIIVNKIHDLIFGDTGGGCVPRYIYTLFNEKVVLALKIQVVDPTTTGSSIYEIGSIQSENLIIYLTNDTKVIVEPGSDGTQFFGENGRRIMFSDLQIGMKIRLISLTIPGDFNFYYLPPDLVTDYDSRFYKSVFRKGAFQEFVKKEMDSKGRFPLQIATTPTTICDRWVEDALQPVYEDMRRNCNQRTETSKTYDVTLAAHMWSPRFSSDGIDSTNDRPTIGDLYSFTMPYAPLTDGSSQAAVPANISVYRDGTSLLNAVQSVDASTSYVSLYDSTVYWDTTTGLEAPVIGNILRFNYKYLADSTNYSTYTEFVFGINYWQLPGAPISNGQGTNFLALPSDVIVSVDGTVIPDAVTDLEAVKGFVTIQDQKDFWLASPLGRVPIISDVLSFQYYQSGSTKYAIIFDDPSREFDDDMVFDGEGTTDPIRTPVTGDSPLQIGYKFRADLLYHASVLNSFDTLRLNNYQKPAKRASIANRQDTLNHFNYFFSPEFLTDTTGNIVLDDQYLDRDIPPAIILNAGTPTFQETYAYQPGMIRQKKLQNIRSNHRLLMYCDLLLKEYQYGNDEINLSSICDNESPRFSVRFREELEKLAECDEWILFDTADTTSIQITIPGDLNPAINLRVAGIGMRNNFVLRDLTSSGVSTLTYSVIDYDNLQNAFQLPDSTRVTVDGTSYDFPALPVMRDATTLATANDVTVRIDGTIMPGIISSFDASTGYVEFYPQADSGMYEYIQITQENIDQRYVKLTNVPLDPENVIVNIEHGPPQMYGYDFEVSGDILFINHPLRSVLSPGDIIIVIYDISSLRDRVIQFSYKIKTTGIVSTIDLEHSRVFDDDYVFPYFCYDGYSKDVGINHTEYINHLSDSGKGIKFTYFNKDTYQLEEHVFSGPIFETYKVSEDEISAMESFPNALIKIANPLGQTDPLNILPNYNFLNDDAIRIRKKTIRELLPDRTFKTTKIIEALPV